MDMKKSVSVHIEELVLHGYPSADRRRIAAAVEQELARLIREQGVSRLSGNPVSLDSVNVGTIRLRANQTAAATGVGIGGAIYRSLGRQGGRRGR
jgi:hypothetical protein